MPAVIHVESPSKNINIYLYAIITLVLKYKVV